MILFKFIRDSKCRVRRLTHRNNVGLDVVMVGCNLLHHKVWLIASVAGTTMLTRAVLKSQPLQDTLVKTIDKTAKTTGKGLAKLFPKLKPGLLKVGKMFSEIPGFAKACGAVLMASSIITGYLMRAKAYNQGKIDQKHADIAQLKNKTAVK